MNAYMGAETAAAAPAQTSQTGWQSFTSGLSDLFNAATPLTTTIIDNVAAGRQQERTYSAQQSIASMFPSTITIPGLNQQIPSWVPLVAVGGLAVYVVASRRRRRRR